MRDQEAADRRADADLVRPAQRGDATALALLLERHAPQMRAVALALLGPGPDADDVTQEAALTALRRIGDVCDPEAVGPWLRMIVRNACRSLLRGQARTEPVGDPAPPAAADADPERWLERSALRDWVWEAIDQLSPTLRMPLVLRHFSQGVTSYEDIARACGTPVGTVRSRLSQARAKLGALLTDLTAAAHSDAAARTAASRQEARDTLEAAALGRFGSFTARRWSPDVDLYLGGRRVGDREALVRGMECDLADGVRQRPDHIVAGRSLAVWEMELISPPDDPEHCPPAVAWLLTLDEGGRVRRVRLHHSRPLRPDQTRLPEAADLLV
ncbi:RNA polymerase sigma factor [Streptomyces sp. NPDC052727]|uniref:RNA polymerase sigma factor n=1 Tax=Streptomyces sp. NPDC052727 TaxID=3154854 RepID=UPI0034150DB2